MRAERCLYIMSKEAGWGGDLIAKMQEWPIIRQIMNWFARRKAISTATTGAGWEQAQKAQQAAAAGMKRVDSAAKWGPMAKNKALDKYNANYQAGLSKLPKTQQDIFRYAPMEHLKTPELMSTWLGTQLKAHPEYVDSMRQDATNQYVTNPKTPNWLQKTPGA